MTMSENQIEEERSIFFLNSIFHQKTTQTISKPVYSPLYNSFYKSQFGDLISSPTRHTVF